MWGRRPRSRPDRDDRGYTKRIFPILLALLAGFVLVSSVAGAVTGAGSTLLAEDEVDAETYSIEYLREGGTIPENAPSSSHRMLPTGEYLHLRTYPVKPGSASWKYLEPGASTNSQTLAVYAARNGLADPIDATLVVDVWQPATRTIQTENGTSAEQVAVNQTVRRYNMTLGPGFNEKKVTLPERYGESYQVSMWLTVDGETVAKWAPFSYRTIPSSKPADTDTVGDIFGWIWWRVILFGGPGVFAGIYAAKKVLQQTGAGPMKGYMWWLIILGLGSVFAVPPFYVEIVTILVRFPQLLGIAFMALAFVGALALHRPYRWILFERDEIRDAKPIRSQQRRRDRATSGNGKPVTDGGQDLDGPEATDVEVDPSEELDAAPDPTPDPDNNGNAGAGEDPADRFNPDLDYKSALYEDLKEVRVVKKDDGDLEIVRPGILPFIARLFADGAQLDPQEIGPVMVETRGKWDAKVYTDPNHSGDWEGPLLHKPASLNWGLPIYETIDEDEGENPQDADLQEEEPRTTLDAIQDRLNAVSNAGEDKRISGGKIVNFGLNAGLLWGGAWAVSTFLLGVPPVAYLLFGGGLVGLSTHAEDGDADYETAPVHWIPAKQTLVNSQREYSDAQTMEQLEDELWRERSSSALESRGLLGRFNLTMTEQLNSVGLGLGGRERQNRDPEGGND